MNDTSTRAPIAHTSVLANSLAAEIGDLMRRITHLVKAIEDASDLVHLPDEDSRKGMDRILVFAKVIEEAADMAEAKAEDIPAQLAASARRAA